LCDCDGEKIKPTIFFLILKICLVVSRYMQKVKIVLKKMRYVHPSKEEYFQSNRPESTDKKTRILTTASRSQSYKTFFLCFKIFAVKLECLLHKEKKSIIIK